MCKAEQTLQSEVLNPHSFFTTVDLLRFCGHLFIENFYSLM